MEFFYVLILFDSDNENAMVDLKLRNGDINISTHICVWKQKRTEMHSYYRVQNPYHDFKHTY